MNLPLEPSNRHPTVRTGRFDGVGDWLLKPTELRELRRGPGGANKAVLFVFGGQGGVGKTYLKQGVRFFERRKYG